ncbi:hypothetical protein AcV5_003960 [Taiwanofungus camphoratus]|nr:hypothetical protein AcV7_007118 [Antrodia cinnamomea]KAI0935561.1 hypothetical protein AcV5_003960 [Antrodia cinnamomea]
MLYRLACTARRFPTRHIAPARTLVSARPAYRTRSVPLARIGLASGVALLLASTIHADAPPERDDESASHAPPVRPPTPLSALIRAYIVYSLCSIPALVDASPSILSACEAIPGLRQLVHAIVRVTFFDQFVGGDTAEDALPLLGQLRAQNKGCLFAYSVEVDEDEAAGKSKGATHAGKQSAHKQIIAETLHCIDVAADFEDRYAAGGKQAGGRKTWVAIKLTAMVPDAGVLARLAQHLVSVRPPASPPVAFPGRPLPSDLDVLASEPGTLPGQLTTEDVGALRELRADLREICARAQERGVRVIVDAEHSWYQPAIDAFVLALQQEFNRLPQPPPTRAWFWSFPAPAPTSGGQGPGTGVQPLVYQTYQAYLRRTPAYLEESAAAARAGGYALGVKLVRGAYHPHELAAHTAAALSSSQSLSPEAHPPVWATKAETDGCYDRCAARVLALVKADMDAGPRSGPTPARVGVLFGTHNWTSCERIVGEMERLGMARPVGDSVVWLDEAATERVAVGQLYGMSDHLTDHLVRRTRCASPFVIKYIPYGNLAEVMPYLSRRAIENKSVLGNGGAAEERKRAGAEIWKRLFG